MDIAPDMSQRSAQRVLPGHGHAASDPDWGPSVQPPLISRRHWGDRLELRSLRPQPRLMASFVGPHPPRYLIMASQA